MSCSSRRVVLITGVSRGLGLSLAKDCLKRGDLVLGVSRTQKHWTPSLKALKKKGLHLFRADLTDEKQVKALVKKLKVVSKRVDILINNAGYAGNLYLTHQLSLRELEKNMTQNLYSAFLLSKHIVPILLKQDHSLVVNVSSMAGRRAVPRLFAYSASKFGVLALSECLAKEYGDQGLKALTVCPGGMNTLMRAELFGKADAKRQQTTQFVSQVIMDVIEEKIKVESGGSITIRHSKITDISPCPGA